MPPAYEILLLNTAVPQIQAAQSGDTYVVPRDIAFSAALTLSAGTANGVPYLNGSKVLTTGSALTFNGAGGFAVNSGSANGSVSATSTGNTAALESRHDISYSRVTSSAHLLDIATLSNQPILFTVNSSEQMRLDSTGLGIGTSSPGAKVHAYDTSNSKVLSQTTTGYAQFQASSSSGDFHIAIDNSTGAGFGAGAYSRLLYSTGVYPMVFFTNATERMTLDSSGNLGLGVTPSAWSGNYKAYQVGEQTISGVAGQSLQTYNAVYNGSWKYINSNYANYIEVTAGHYRWFTAPSGTAGNAISFTQRMTLTEAGNLGIGETSPTAKLHIYEPTAAAARIRVLANGGQQSAIQLAGNGATFGTTSFDVFQDGGSDAYVANRANASLQFWTNNTERARITSGGNFKIGGSADRATTEGDKQLVLFDGTAPVGTLANGVSFYSASGEANVMDAAGNATLLSPHDAVTNEWIFRSKHTPTGKVLKIDVERLLKFVNDHFGLDAVHEFIED